MWVNAFLAVRSGSLEAVLSLPCLQKNLFCSASLLSSSLFFWDRVSLCSPVCPGTHHVDQPASAEIKGVPPCLAQQGNSFLLCFSVWDKVLLQPRLKLLIFLPLSTGMPPCLTRGTSETQIHTGPWGRDLLERRNPSHGALWMRHSQGQAIQALQQGT